MKQQPFPNLITIHTHSIGLTTGVCIPMYTGLSAIKSLVSSVDGMLHHKMKRGALYTF